LIQAGQKIKHDSGKARRGEFDIAANSLLKMVDGHFNQDAFVKEICLSQLNQDCSRSEALYSILQREPMYRACYEAREHIPILLDY
jgi:hypothetical protein